jgi:hypothetical protein
VQELAALLDAHLTFEEANVISQLRRVKDFPAPSSEAEAAMYAQGFAWSLNGLAPEVVEQVQQRLPQVVIAKLTEARGAFEQRCMRAWGSAQTGKSRTSVPDWLVAEPRS